LKANEEEEAEAAKMKAGIGEEMFLW